MTAKTSAKKKAKQLIKYIRPERPDYNYLRELFRYIRKELGIKRPTKTKKIPYVPTEAELKKYYEAVWQSKNMTHMILIKTLLYTGIRVSEIIHVKLEDVDIKSHQICIKHGNKNRTVPFPVAFGEALAMHCKRSKDRGERYLFESSWKKKYSDRGVRAILMHYTRQAEIVRSISPYKLRHFLFAWLKKQGIDDALIHLYSGHDSRKSLEIYDSAPSLSKAQQEYRKVMESFPI